MPLNTFLSSTGYTPRSLERKGRMRATCSWLSQNNWAITHPPHPVLEIPLW